MQIQISVFSDVFSQISTLLRHHPDLQEEFWDFFQHLQAHSSETSSVTTEMDSVSQNPTDRSREGVDREDEEEEEEENEVEEKRPAVINMSMTLSGEKVIWTRSERNHRKLRPCFYWCLTECGQLVSVRTYSWSFFIYNSKNHCKRNNKKITGDNEETDLILKHFRNMMRNSHKNPAAPVSGRRTAPSWRPVDREEPIGKRSDRCLLSWETRPPNRWGGGWLQCPGVNSRKLL